MVVVDRIKLVKPTLEKLKKGNDGLLRLEDGSPADQNSEVRVASRAVEGSNANPVDALVTMISLQRQFEMQVKMMKAEEDNATTAAKLLQI
ncbi:hypothetical protein CCP3SC1AL1_2100007 [Gammaproteobacteria bacterium]